MAEDRVLPRPPCALPHFLVILKIRMESGDHSMGTGAEMAQPLKTPSTTPLSFSAVTTLGPRALG